MTASGGHRAYASLLAVFAAAFYVAVIVAAFGMISLFTNTDVIADPNAGPIVGPLMSGSATLVLFAFLLAIGLARRPEAQRITPLGGLGIGVVCYLVFIGAGAILSSIGEDRPLHAFAFVIRMVASPFSITVGVLAFVEVLLYELILASRFQDKPPLRWPWEK